MIEIESDGDGAASTSENGEGEDGDELGEDFTMVYLHVLDTLDQLEQQAGAIGRRAVVIDSLPGASARPAVVATILNAIGARDERPGRPM
eukprot:1371508-Lingulodinium_polyedra.AAC.1